MTQTAIKPDPAKPDVLGMMQQLETEVARLQSNAAAYSHLCRLLDASTTEDRRQYPLVQWKARLGNDKVVEAVTDFSAFATDDFLQVCPAMINYHAAMLYKSSVVITQLGEKLRTIFKVTLAPATAVTTIDGGANAVDEQEGR